MFRKIKSLTAQLNIWIAISLAVSALVFFAASNFVHGKMDEYFNSDAYEAKINQKNADRFAEFVSSNDVSSEDFEVIDEYVQSQMTFIYVYRDGIMVYAPYYTQEELEEYQYEEADYEDYYVFTISFSDTDCHVAFYDYSSEQVKSFATVVIFFVSALLFFLLIYMGMRRPLKRIAKLNESIHILEGGDLDYHIESQGNNEIATLSESLENMRIAFKEKLQDIIDMEEASNTLVTEMAHDIRTPITSLQMYLDFALEEAEKEGKSEELKSYIRKAKENTEFIKTFSNDTFELFLINSSKVYMLEKEEFNYAISEHLSFMEEYLRSCGFSIEEDFAINNDETEINHEVISRLMSNITKNIERYADKSVPIKIGTMEEYEKIVLYFANKVKDEESCEESTGLGKKIMERLMNTLGGECVIKEEGGRYEIKLIFPKIKENK
ncbi:MAG: HAMP domain-containing histidine kinase [Eubacterium sp.]|nr:HAMP domain-containing histidine kinase [Eubacterium sp.]